MTSSGLARVAMPGITSYSSTKALVSRFCESLAYEVSDKVDVMAWEAGAITTKMNPNTGLMSLSAPAAVKACLRQIGHEKRTRGHWWHELQSVMFACFYLPFFGKMIAESIRKKYKEKSN